MRPVTVSPPTQARATLRQSRLLAPLQTALITLMLFICTVPGMRLQLLALSMLVVWLGWKALRRQPLMRSPLTWPLLAVLATTGLSTVGSIDPRTSFDGLVWTLTVVSVGLLTGDALGHGWQPERFIHALLGITSIVLLHGLVLVWQWHWGWYTLRVPEYPLFPVQFRLFGTSLHPNFLAALINFALPFAALRLWQAPNRSRRIFWAAWLGVAVVALLFSRSRGSWVAATVIVPLLTGWILLQYGAPHHIGLRRWLKQTWRVWATISGYVAWFAALWLVSSNATSEFSTSGGGIASGGGRFLFWRIAWDTFLAHPLLGSGPLTYWQAYIAHVPATRSWIAPHAHNVVFDTLAQQGLLGMLAFSSVVVIGGWSLIRGWWRCATEHRPVLAGSVLALTGYLVHSCFDVVSSLSLVAFVVVMIASVGVHVATTTTNMPRVSSRWSAIATCPAAALLGLVLWQADARDALMTAVLADQAGDTTATVNAVEYAVSRDPQLAFYNLQRGHLYSQFNQPANDAHSATAAQLALASYALAEQAGIQDVPSLLNQAWLYEHGGDNQRAQNLIALAARPNNDWALPWLLLTERDDAEATARYAHAFASEVHAREMAACRSSAACRAFAAAAPQSVVALAHQRSRSLLETNQPQAALQVLQQIPLSSIDPLPWLDRTDAHIALGQLPQARYTLRMATTLGAENPGTAAQYALTRANFLASTGRQAEVEQTLRRAVKPTVIGRPFDLAAFGGVGLPNQLVPQLDLLQRTADDLAIYRRLTQIYAEQGRTADAAWAQGRSVALAALLGR
jgi:O-antigen ligase